jgi:hypothetical protein
VATTGGASDAALGAGFDQKMMVYAVSAAFVLLLASEVLGRLLFYTANVRIGF